MGRKKRKTASDDTEEDAIAPSSTTESGSDNIKTDEIKADAGEAKNQQNSVYAITSHSGEIIQEDIYVSDGSESGDEDSEGNKIEVVLAGSRMGMMRRGLHHPLVQPKRQWTRAIEESDEPGNTLTPEQKRQLEEEELAKLDPAERAARLLQEKQRKMEEAKDLARRRESEENAGRDAMHFSKRTAFDIRFDQIEDKPWLRGNGDNSDFFNYGLTEEEWLEYSEHQLLIRQELLDAKRQKRKPDPTLVPVTPREPSTQTKENPSGDDEASSGDGNVVRSMDESSEEAAVINMGPERPANIKKEAEQPAIMMKHEEHLDIDLPADIGGAWGAGAAPGSMLAKLIEQQEHQDDSYSAHPPQYQEQNHDDDMAYKAPVTDYRPNHRSQEQTSVYGDNGYNDSKHYGDGGNFSNYNANNRGESVEGGRGHRHRDQDGSGYPPEYPPPHHNYGHEQYDSGYRRGDERSAAPYGSRSVRGGRGQAPQFGGRDNYTSRKRSWDGDNRRR